MALARWQSAIVDNAGNVLPAAQITVRREVSGAPLAVLYTDRDGVTPLGNPFAADGDGFAAFHALGGAHRIDVVSGSFSRTLRYVAVGTLAEQDSAAVSAIAISDYVDFTEIAEPSGPSSNIARIYAVDDGSGVTTMMYKDSAGDVVPLSHFLQAGTGAVTRTQHAKMRDAVSAFDFIPVAEHAAILDGTSTTDVFSYLNAAMTAGAGGRVFLPEGLYNCSDDIKVPAYTHVIGYGATLKATAGNVSNPVLLEVANHAGNVLVEGVTFDGNITGLVTAAFNNVCTMFQATRVQFHRCKWQNCKGIAGIWSTNCSYGGVYECEIENCGNYDLISLVDADRKQGIALTSTGVDRFTAAFCRFNDVGLDPLAIQGSTDSRVIGNHFDGTRAAVYISNSIRPIIIGNTFTGAQTPSDLLGGPGLDCINSVDMVVANNIAYNNDSCGILLSNIDGATISGNISKNNQNASLGFTPNHLGGICISATNGEICRDIILTGNHCYDDRAGANVKQIYAVHIFDQGGTFDNIRIDKTNRFEGYDASGNKNANNIFSSGDLGYSGRDVARRPQDDGRKYITAAVNNSATPSTVGVAAVAIDASGGTLTGINQASTSYFTRQHRVDAASAASTGSNTGLRCRDFKFRQDAHRTSTRFGWEDFATNAAAFIGLKGDAAHGNADPSSFTNCIGIGIDAGQTTWRLLHNDAAGSATATDLGARFPANTDATDWYELEIWWGDAASNVHWKLTRCNTGDIVRGNIETNLPSLTAVLNSHIVANTRTGSSAITLAFGQCVGEFS